MVQQKHVAVIPDLMSEYDRNVVYGVSRFVHEDRQWILHLLDDPRHKIAQLQRWRGHGVIADTDDAKVLQAVKKLDVPVVGFGGVGRQDDKIYFLRGENEAIARLAAEHLLDRGFTNFAYCGWPAARSNPWSPERGRYFRQIIRQAGFECDVFAARGGAHQWSRLLEELSTWVGSLDKPVGLMAANDARARQVLEACRQIGAAVPDEVAVIGVDNNELMCNVSIPPLSSIVHGGERLGYEACLLLKRLMAGHRPRGALPTVPPMGVVVRQSSDTLAIDDPDVAAAVRFIRDNSGRPLQVRDVVSQTSVSRATLETRFKQLVGHTIHGEIRRVQIRQVQHLLRTTKLPLHKIAECTGFQYAQYLAAVFREACGQTPGQYRDQWAHEKR